MSHLLMTGRTFLKASIKKYGTARGHAWRVQYRSPDGKSRTKQGFRTKNVAHASTDTNAVSIITEEWIDPGAKKIKLQELYKAWWATLTPRRRSCRRQLNSAWDHHVKLK